MLGAQVNVLLPDHSGSWGSPGSVLIWGVAGFLKGSREVPRLPRWLSGEECSRQCRATRGLGFSPWVGKAPEGSDNPLQGSCLGNPTERGAWRAAVHGITKELDMTERPSSNVKGLRVGLGPFWSPGVGVQRRAESRRLGALQAGPGPEESPVHLGVSPGTTGWAGVKAWA